MIIWLPPVSAETLNTEFLNFFGPLGIFVVVLLLGKKSLSYEKLENYLISITFKVIYMLKICNY